MKVLITRNGESRIVGLDDENDRAWQQFKAWLQSLEPGEVAEFEFHKARNYKFLKKFFAMLKIGFDAWEPRRKKYKGHAVQKNFERFRKDLTIAAGFYDLVATVSGGLRHEAKSISFASMEQDEFERVYSAVADVLLQGVLVRYNRAELDRVVDELMKFTA